MPDLDDLTASLSDDATLQSIAAQVGVDPQTARQAIGVALPALLGGLTMSANDPARAQGLATAVQKDHDGAILDQFAGMLGSRGPEVAGDGDKILAHLFGDETGDVAQGLSGKSGVSPALLSKLLPLLAPLVMGWLGKRMSGSGAGAAAASPGPGGSLSDILGGALAGLGANPSALDGGGSKASSITDLLGSLLGGGQSGGNEGGLGGLLGKVFGA